MPIQPVSMKCYWLNHIWVTFSFKIYFDHCLHYFPKTIFDSEPFEIRNTDNFNRIDNADILFWFYNFYDVEIVKCPKWFSELLQKLLQYGKKPQHFEIIPQNDAVGIFLRHKGSESNFFYRNKTKMCKKTKNFMVTYIWFNRGRTSSIS